MNIFLFTFLLKLQYKLATCHTTTPEQPELVLPIEDSHLTQNDFLVRVKHAGQAG